MTDFDYDIETYRNMFSAGFYSHEHQKWWVYEISDRRNDTEGFVQFIYYLRDSGSRTAGFNCEHFDYAIIHKMIQTYEATGKIPIDLSWRLAQEIIHGDDRWGHVIWPNERLFQQVDLYKIHHFDNRAKSTSLKKVEVNSRSMKVIDLPYDPMIPLTDEQKDETIRYMCHDIAETSGFRQHSVDKIRFRDELAARYPDMGDVVNFNDTKIGKKFFERELNRETPGITHERVNGRRQPRQTHRSHIDLGDVVLPWIQFENPEFRRVIEYLRSTTIVETKGAFQGGLHADVGGLRFHFGTGGIHASLSNMIVRADDQHDIIDIDVASYYPNLAITNGFYPEHLSDTFCRVYENLYNMRKGYPKKSAENAMLKLALNGVYGDSNNIYSPFYDPKYTMSITVNGQLLLCLLSEWLLQPGVEIIQANTDGVTLRVDKRVREWVMSVCKYWESVTKLELEYVDYTAMMIRDVNNYMAVKTDGSVKRIGCYTHETAREVPYTRERQWHSDQNALVVPKAAEAALVRGEDIATFIKAHNDPFDFMLSIKVRKSDSLVLEDETKLQSITRYYMSTGGKSMFKVMPPLAKTPEKIRRNAVQAGWKVRIVDDASEFRWEDVNWVWYINEAKKLVDCLQGSACNRKESVTGR